jgi:hypothetical protein
LLDQSNWRTEHNNNIILEQSSIQQQQKPTITTIIVYFVPQPTIIHIIIRKVHAHLAIMQLFFIVLLTSVSARSPSLIPIIERQRPHDYDSTDALKTSLFRCALPIKCPSSTSSNDLNPNGPPSPLQSLPVAAPFTDESSPSDRVSWDSEAHKHMCRRFPPFQAKFHLLLDLKPSQSIHPPITKPTSSAASIFLLSLNKDDVNTSAACGEYEPLIPVCFNGSRQSDPIPAPNLRHSQHSISDLANHSQDTHTYFGPHLLPSTIHQFHGIFTQPFWSRIDIQMIQLSFLVSRFTRFADHLQVSFYFPIPTSQAQAFPAVRDMYSYDNNPFCFLPATIHFNTDPDFSFSALCTIQPYLLYEFLQQHFRSDIEMNPAFHASHDSTRHQATSKLEKNYGFRSKISLELSYFALSRSQHCQADDRPRLLQVFCHQQSPANLPVHCTIHFVFYHAQRSLHSGDKEQMLAGFSDQQCSLYSGVKDQMLVGISDQHFSLALYSEDKDQMLVGISDQHFSAVGDTDQHISYVGVHDQHAHVFSSILSFSPSFPSFHHLQRSFQITFPSTFQHQSTSSYQSSQHHPNSQVNSIRPIKPASSCRQAHTSKQAHNFFHSLPVWGDCKMPLIRTQSAHDLIKYIIFSPFSLVSSPSAIMAGMNSFGSVLQ